MLEIVLPNEIEKRSFEIIAEELGDKILDPKNESIIKRVIHTSADFEYADALCFSDGAVEIGIAALKKGATIITDTSMAAAGINKKNLNKLGGVVRCFIGDDDVAERAQREGTTRSSVCMDKAASLKGPLIVAVGNAPTALIRLNELIKTGSICPELIIGVPVGFVNVVESKEIIMSAGIPFIVAQGRKGGSNVAAAICNALMLEANK
jgi:precorrin-8X/cobalt-precorrin-8 methylmutase